MRRLLLFGPLLLAGISCTDLGDSISGGDSGAEFVSYSLDIAPLLATNCLLCHSAGSPSGGLDLSSHAGILAGGTNGDAIVAWDSSQGELPRRIQASGSFELMPPTGALADEEINTILSWIEDGALNN
jgi:hypothetical protein